TQACSGRTIAEQIAFIWGQTKLSFSRTKTAWDMPSTDQATASMTASARAAMLSLMSKRINSLNASCRQTLPRSSRALTQSLRASWALKSELNKPQNGGVGHQRLDPLFD